MTQATAEKPTPKTVSIDVDTESYSKGYEDAYIRYTKQPAQYWGHDSQYWVDYAVAWLPIVLLAIFFLVVTKKATTRQKILLDKYTTLVETQIKALQESQITNKLLGEILAKPDKK
jgi:hypothetical protein